MEGHKHFQVWEQVLSHLEGQQLESLDWLYEYHTTMYVTVT